MAMSNNQYLGIDGSGGGGIKSIQRGGVNVGFNVPNGLTFVNITPVNPAKSILLFTTTAPILRIEGYSDIQGGWDFSGNIEGNGSRIYFRSFASSYNIHSLVSYGRSLVTWLSPFQFFNIEWQLVEYK